MERAGIVDTCVCIDLAHGRMLTHLIRIGLRWVLPDAIAHELRRPPAADFVAAGMEIVAASPEEVAQVQVWRRAYRKPSTADLFALAMARARGAVLLTGDRHLRAAAEEQGVEAHGVLWVLDRREGHVARPRLVAALEAMQAAGARLPAGEVAQRLARWRGRV